MNFIIGTVLLKSGQLDSQYTHLLPTAFLSFGSSTRSYISLALIDAYSELLSISLSQD